MAISVGEFGQRQVETGLHFRPGAHRDAETGSAGTGAVDGDDEGLAPPRLVTRIGAPAAVEHLVVDRQRMDIAGAHPEKRVTGYLRRVVLDGEALASAPGTPKPFRRRVQIALPGLRAGPELEHPIPAAVDQTVAAAVLFVAPARGQVVHGRNRLENDGTVGDPRPDDPIAVADQGVDQALQAVPVDQHLVATGHIGSRHRSSPLQRAQLVHCYPYEDQRKQIPVGMPMTPQRLHHFLDAPQQELS